MGVGILGMFRSRHRRTVRGSHDEKRRGSRRRILRVECLEDRALLTAAPTVDLELLGDAGAPDVDVAAEPLIGDVLTDGSSSSYCAVEVADSGGGGQPAVDGDILLALGSADNLDVYGPQQPLTATSDVDGDPLSPSPVPDPVAEDQDVFAPWIESLTAVYDGGDEWIFEGVVDFYDPTSLTVYFGGALAGETATVDEYGIFTFTATIPVDHDTVVSAQARGGPEGVPDSNIREVQIG